MNPDHEKLIDAFEGFQLDLEVETILKKVGEEECIRDEGVTEFAEQLKEREQQKRAAQAARETQVQQQWSPGHYPQLTCAWFVESLDFCCPYWRYQFKRPHTPPPATPPSPTQWKRKRPRKR